MFLVRFEHTTSGLLERSLRPFSHSVTCGKRRNKKPIISDQYYVILIRWQKIIWFVCLLFRHVGRGEGTVCWIGVKVAVLCAQQYMSWNIFLIKVLNNFWYFEHPILTMIYSEAYLKHNWRNCLWKKQKSTIYEDNFFNNVTNMLLSKS